MCGVLAGDGDVLYSDVFPIWLVLFILEMRLT